MKSGSYSTDDAEESDGVHGVAPAPAENRRERQLHSLEPGTMHHTCAVARASVPFSSAISQEKSRARRQACPGLLSWAPEWTAGQRQRVQRQARA